MGVPIMQLYIWLNVAAVQCLALTVWHLAMCFLPEQTLLNSCKLQERYNLLAQARRKAHMAKSC